MRQILEINDYIVITNLKVMYTAINKIPNKEPKSLDKPIIFLYRSIESRVISCFINWCVKKYEAKNNWLLKLLKISCIYYEK